MVFIFKLINRHIKIISIPKKLNKLSVIPLDSQTGQLIIKMINNTKIKKNGKLDLPDELLTRIIEQYEAKKKTEEKEEEKKD